MIRHRENGLLVPIRDEQALYMVVHELIEHPALARQFSAEAAKVRAD